MVKHIVIWKLKDEANGRSKDANAKAIKEKLEALVGVVPGLLKAEVGLDFRRSRESADAGLYSEFDSREAFEAFLSHPAHKEVQPLVREARSERMMLDYEVWRLAMALPLLCSKTFRLPASISPRVAGSSRAGTQIISPKFSPAREACTTSAGSITSAAGRDIGSRPMVSKNSVRVSPGHSA